MKVYKAVKVKGRVTVQNAHGSTILTMNRGVFEDQDDAYFVAKLIADFLTHARKWEQD